MKPQQKISKAEICRRIKASRKEAQLRDWMKYAMLHMLEETGDIRRFLEITYETIYNRYCETDQTTKRARAVYSAALEGIRKTMDEVEKKDKEFNY